MARDISRQLMNKGNSGERRLGRQLSRGRSRNIPTELQLALDTANRIIKDFGAAPPADAMVGQDIYNPTPDGGKKRKSRLEVVHE